MPFAKGHKKSPKSGMMKGHKTKKIQQWEKLGEYITGELTEDVLNYIKGLEPKDQFIAFQQLLNYFKPKKKDITSNGEKILNFDNINVNISKSNSE